MKKKSFLVGSTLAVAAAGLTLAAVGIRQRVSVTVGSEPGGNHYAQKLATTSESGWKEYWISCETGEVFLEEPASGVWVDRDTPESGGAPTIGHAAYVSPMSYSVSSDLTMVYNGKAPVASDYVTTNSDGAISATWFDATGANVIAAPTDAGSYKVSFSVAQGTDWAAFADPAKRDFVISPYTTNIIDGTSNAVVTSVTNDDNDFFVKTADNGDMQIRGWWLHLNWSNVTIPACVSSVTILLRNPSKSTYRMGFRIDGSWTADLDSAVTRYNSDYDQINYDIGYSTSARTLNEFKILLEGTTLNVYRIWFGTKWPTVKITDSGPYNVTAPDGHGLANDSDKNLVIRSNGGTGDDGWFSKVRFTEPFNFTTEFAGATALAVTMKCSFARTVTYRFEFNNATVQNSATVGTDFTTFSVLIPVNASRLVSFGFDYGNAFDYIHTVKSLEFVTPATTVRVDGVAVDVASSSGNGLATNGGILEVTTNGGSGDTGWFSRIELDTNGVAIPSGKDTVRFTVRRNQAAASDIYWDVHFDNQSVRLPNMAITSSEYTTYDCAIPSGATKLLAFGFNHGNENYTTYISGIDFIVKPVTVLVDGVATEVTGVDGTAVSNDANGYLVADDWWNCIHFDNVVAPAGKDTIAIQFETLGRSYLYVVKGEPGADAWQHGVLADAGGTQLAADGDGWLILPLDFSVAASRKVVQINVCNTVVGINTIKAIEFR